MKKTVAFFTTLLPCQNSVGLALSDHVFLKEPNLNDGHHMIEQQPKVLRPQSQGEGSWDAADLAAMNLLNSVADTVTQREPRQGPKLGEAVVDLLREDTKVYLGPVTKTLKATLTLVRGNSK